MTETLPLFPLGTVLFPGLVLPLHVFEDRYRRLMHDLRQGEDPARFGVIAIRTGRETGADGIQALYQVGCAAEVREVTEHDDGRFDLVTVGTQRFRLLGIDSSLPYLRGEVEFLADEAGPGTGDAVVAVQQLFRTYLDSLATRGEVRVSLPDLPDDPVLLSYLVAASMIIEVPDRQSLLAMTDAGRRLAAERALLAREITMLTTLTSTPAPDLRHSPYSPN